MYLKCFLSTFNIELHPQLNLFLLYFSLASTTCRRYFMGDRISMSVSLYCLVPPCSVSFPVIHSNSKLYNTEVSSVIFSSFERIVVDFVSHLLQIKYLLYPIYFDKTKASHVDLRISDELRQFHCMSILGSLL